PMSAGELVTVVRFDPFADDPTFDLDLSMRGAPLRDFNSFLRAYAGFDVERGTMRVYSQLGAEDHHFEGYLKPFFEDVDVLQLEEVTHQSVFKTLWEAVVGALGEGLKDSEHDRVATRIPVSGTVRDPRFGFWPTLGNALKNAFIESLVPRLDHSVRA